MPVILTADEARSAFWSGVWSGVAILVVTVALVLFAAFLCLWQVELAYASIAEHETALQRARRLTSLTEEQARCLVRHAPETLVETEGR